MLCGLGASSNLSYGFMQRVGPGLSFSWGQLRKMALDDASQPFSGFFEAFVPSHSFIQSTSTEMQIRIQAIVAVRDCK